MISHLRGVVVGRGPGFVVVSVGGVGFRVTVPPDVAATREGSELSLHVTLVVRQDALELFGFATAEDRDFFEVLSGLTRVGPRTAFSLVAALGASRIRDAVARENPAVLASVPGIGTKTAARIMLELKSKLEAGDIASVAGASDLVELASQALVQLGYSRQEAMEAIRGLAIEPGAPVEDVVRAALRRVSREA